MLIYLWYSLYFSVVHISKLFTKKLPLFDKIGGFCEILERKHSLLKGKYLSTTPVHRLLAGIFKAAKPGVPFIFVVSDCLHSKE